MKKIVILFLSIFLLPITVNGMVSGSTPYSSKNFNVCVKNHTCLLLCGYTNKVQYTVSYVNPKYYYYSSYLYYSFSDNKVFVEYTRKNDHDGHFIENRDLHHKDVYLSDDALYGIRNAGKCPNNSYFDVADMSSLSSEVCFDDDGTYCKNDRSNLGTKFDGESSLEYNYETQVTKYFDEFTPLILNNSCEKLKSESIHLQEDFLTDFRHNFLYGNAIPVFIEDSDAYKQGFVKLGNQIEILNNKCKEEIQEKLDNGNITESEYEEELKKVEHSSENLKNEMNQAKEIIKKSETENETNQSNHSAQEINYDSSDDLSKNQLKSAFEVCTKPSYRKTMKIVGLVIKVVRIVVPLLILVMGIKDLYTAVVGNKEDTLFKAIKNIGIRLLAGVLIFLLPSIIQFLITLVSTWNDEGYQNHFSCCTDCALNFDCDKNSACNE
ncbi:MAG: hypothetical protein IJ704_04925 [Bacilli bacterium]|nr:hypothetical protein [Bacilli bacterium]